MRIRSAMGSAADKAGDIAASAVKKGSEVIESAKLNFALRSEKKKLERMFSVLGKLLYEQVAGTDVRTQIKAQIMEISEQKLVIEDINSHIKDASGKEECEFCGSYIDVESAYCPNCGRSRGINISNADETVSFGEDDADPKAAEDAVLAAEDAVDALE